MFSPELLPTGNHALPKCALVFFVCILYCGQNVANVAKHKLNSFRKMLGSTFWRAQILGIQASFTFFGHGFCGEESSSSPLSAHHRILAAVQGVS